MDEVKTVKIYTWKYDNGAWGYAVKQLYGKRASKQIWVGIDISLIFEHINAVGGRKFRLSKKCPTDGISVARQVLAPVNQDRALTAEFSVSLA